MDYISHHGIKGQRWGVRRWQYKNGSLTPDGYVHYGYGNKQNRAAKQSDPSSPDSQQAQDSGSNSAAALLTMSIMLDIATLNVPYLVIDLARSVNAGYSYLKDKGYEKQRAKSPVEEATGLRVKAYESTWKQDLAAVNPGFHNFNSNTKSNCMLASMAYDLRRRGFDVAAGKNSKGLMEETLKVWYPGAHTATLYDSGAKASLSSAGGFNVKLTKEITKTLAKEPPNSRGIITITAADGLSGHAYIYQVDDKGKGYFLDPQSNERYGLFSNPIAAAKDVHYTRIDNIRFDPSAVKEYLR